MKISSIFSLLVILCISGAAFAQDNVTVPDVSGLTVPQAAALLNNNGLQIGAVTNVSWSDASGLPQNSISEQSVAVGSEVASGTAIDVTRLQATNMALVYDGNLVTFINRSGSVLDISNLIFRADNGSEFPALRWTNILPNSECGQIWSIQQRVPFELAECNVTYWQSTQQTILHFWTGDSGATQFDVIQDGESRATCMAAPAGSAGGTPTTCDFYLPTAGVDIDDTAYIYMVYDENALAIINQSDAQWMRTDLTTLINYNPGQATVPTEFLPGGEAARPLYTLTNAAADIARLAPGQCVLFTTENPDAAAPQPCDVIATFDLPGTLAFWLEAFEVESDTDTQRRICPVMTPGAMTLCVMPR